MVLGGRAPPCPLDFLGVYLNYANKYRCASCKRTTIHQRRKATVQCRLWPLLGFGIFGEWKQDGCQ
jgi:hypothetical protein